MRSIPLIFFFTVLISSCSNGKLDYSENCPRVDDIKTSLVKLINTSGDEKITFTIKITTSAKWNDKVEIETKTYALNSGEKQEIGCLESDNEKYTYELVGELKAKVD